MLRWFEGQRVEDIPKKHQIFYEMGRNRIDDVEFNDICEFINSEIDQSIENAQSKTKVCYVPGWKAPKDWTSLPLQAIYDKAFPGDAELSAYWYGLVTMKVIIKRTDSWVGIKTQFTGRNFEQAAYWLES